MEGVERMNINKDFYNGKTVLVTGHTGFKGSWLCKILSSFGAKVVGYSLSAPTSPNLFEIGDINKECISIIDDIRDFDKLLEVFKKFKPEIVFHLAAQPLVRDSYLEPRYTYETNVMGTVNILECCRLNDCVKSVLNVTTDKVYFNSDQSNHSFKEEEPLDGFDPYSNSKSCSELVTHSYIKSFFSNTNCSISTARAGNVIGGGDFAKDRIIPDCVRAVINNKNIIVRNPYSTRPYQHVLEALFMYLIIVEKQFDNKKYSGFYNIGPDSCDCVTTGELVDLFCKYYGNNIKWINKCDNGPHEANYLKLDNSKIKKIFGWKPVWHIDKCIKETVNFTKKYIEYPKNIPFEMESEINEYMRDFLNL